MTRLLIVDDSPLMRRLLSGIFTAEADFEVEVARDGVEALAKLHSFHPDVITLDVHMPALDGIACLNRIMIERPCPVVMVSGRTAEGAAETMTALELGAVDFMPKPDGAVSLEIDALRPLLIDKVRTAAQARVKASSRLAERVRARSRGVGRTTRRRAESVAGAKLAPVAASDAPGLVLVGTSTGGPRALEVLLTGLPASFPWPILVAQHMPAFFTSALATRLDKLCALHIAELSAPTVVEAGTVYIARGEADMVLRRRGGTLVASAAPADPNYPWHPSADRLVRSALGVVPPEQLVGVLMTGMGNDGAAAMAEIKAGGGRTIAESEKSAVVWGMPGELVKLGGASTVAPVDQIAGLLVEALA
ncbi:chemotaxis-specific protein-glutamate methyltransferase CheB [Sphingomonas sp. BN140010]|uniref:Protein-glutamate methylesterase/protein-glutamine glutaminase n=1 Tax=Sphingomonas arvum TaxID=2992113 RepID=A0ABT3JC03_9SPHN|nr:chemotaxis-specific protein-glutamate methyltransferase CheB [Sphingomonas sp. BN140010]MCW3796331.1 chemotaxis-specific protein-glutamate methyltransferase CheB [Sphingomonas sp. BN140010]